MDAIRCGECRIVDVAGVSRRSGLEEQDMRLRLGSRTMFDASWHDQKLAGPDIDGMVAELHPEMPLDAEEQLVLGIVMMPDELPLKLHQLHLLAVESANDLRPPVFGDQRQLVAQVDLVQHSSLPSLPSLPFPVRRAGVYSTPCLIRDAMCSAPLRWARWPSPPASTISSARAAVLHRTSSLSWQTIWDTPTSAATAVPI